MVILYTYKVYLHTQVHAQLVKKILG